MELVSGGTGGSLSLAGLIDDHGEAIDAQLRATYHCTLDDLYLGRVRASQVLRWLMWAPEDGPFAASLRGGRDHMGHGAMWHLTADVWDLQMAVAHGQGSGKGKPPTHPRPGEKKRRSGRR